jgi:spore cortex formation protein SpoVR/YcgB (stage V sporulation)
MKGKCVMLKKNREAHEQNGRAAGKFHDVRRNKEDCNFVRSFLCEDLDCSPDTFIVNKQKDLSSYANTSNQQEHPRFKSIFFLFDSKSSM